MDSINWLNIQLSPEELYKLNEDIHESVPVPNLLEKIVLLIQEDYPWEGRADKIACFHPCEFYKNGQWISLPIHDKERILPPVFQVAQVLQAEMAENPIQGSFQVLTLDVNGLHAKLACGIPNAPFPEITLDEFSAEQRIFLANWITNVYSEALHSACTNYISKGELQGHFQNGLYIPIIAKMPDTTIDLVTKEAILPEPTSQSVFKKIWQKLLLFIKHLFRREK